MRLFVLIFSLLLSVTACSQEGGEAAAPKYQSGVHYVELAKPVDVDDPSKIELAEVFWYGCGHCFHFEPYITEWKKTKPDDVNFVAVPAMWNGAMEGHARMFYTAKNLGILDKAHSAIFNAMHPAPPSSLVVVPSKPKQFGHADEISEFLSQFGVDAETVKKELTSHTVTLQVQDANKRARAYQISGTPQLVVNGKYRIETNQNVSQQQMFDIADFLIEKARTENK